MEEFRGGLVFKSQRLLYQITLGSRVIKKKKKKKKGALREREGLGVRVQVCELECTVQGAGCRGPSFGCRVRRGRR